MCIDTTEMVAVTVAYKRLTIKNVACKGDNRHIDISRCLIHPWRSYLHGFASQALFWVQEYAGTRVCIINTWLATLTLRFDDVSYIAHSSVNRKYTGFTGLVIQLTNWCSPDIGPSTTMRFERDTSPSRGMKSGLANSFLIAWEVGTVLVVHWMKPLPFLSFNTSSWLNL